MAWEAMPLGCAVASGPCGAAHVRRARAQPGALGRLRRLPRRPTRRPAGPGRHKTTLAPATEPVRRAECDSISLFGLYLDTALPAPSQSVIRRHPDDLIVGLVSISDRATSGVYQDQGVPALREWLGTALSSSWQAVERLVPDEADAISAALIDLVDNCHCDLVLTTGGTGPARRDVTPEATLAVATKEMPGFGEQMRQVSLKFVPTAILSRQVAVIRETADHAALIINLPG